VVSERPAERRAVRLARAIEALVDAKVAAALSDRTFPEQSPWLSLEAAARYAFVSERTMARWVKRGKLQTTTIGRRRLVLRESLDDLLRAAAREEVTPATSPRRRGE
jgi:excisionase family DNA binding protein